LQSRHSTTWATPPVPIFQISRYILVLDKYLLGEWVILSSPNGPQSYSLFKVHLKSQSCKNFLQFPILMWDLFKILNPCIVLPFPGVNYNYHHRLQFLNSSILSYLPSHSLPLSTHKTLYIRYLNNMELFILT
jgi:hypothetical protein